MPVISSGVLRQQAPSCVQRMKHAFCLGFAVGLASSALFGGLSSLRYGLRGRELVSNVSKIMIQSGGSFGTFMAIGAGLRC